VTVFSDLIKRSSRFVEKQRGLWDHEAWTSFVSELQKKGVKLTEDAQAQLGSVVESMKRFHHNSSDAKQRLMGEISDKTAQFIAQTRGMYNHADWENFLGEIQRLGVELRGETVNYVGDLLEAVKRFYNDAAPALGKAEPKARTPAPTKKAGSDDGGSVRSAPIKKAPAKKTTAKKTTAKKTTAKKTAKKSAKKSAKKTTTKKS
jgi:hypothetical protein